jgi:hypothetical protein
MRFALRLAAAAALLSAPAFAQQPIFTTPGMPIWAASGQTDRFTNQFNPAIGALLDAFGDYVETGETGENDGFDLFIRSFEMTINGRVDPNWWGYAVIVYSDDEVELEESAVTYAGFDSNTTIRFGRFFVDFGKQMQAHIHDLPTPERPRTLATYLGEELPGVGVQADHWWPTGDESALRASVGVFGDFELGEEDEGPAIGLVERKDADEFGLTARVTQFMDVGQRGVFQWGASARHLSSFGAEDEATGASAADLSNTVFGLDLTYGVDSDDGFSGWTFGGELLLNTGDIGLEVDEANSVIDVLDDEGLGFYVWAERRIDVTNTVGVLYDLLERPESGAPQDQEITAYYTRYFSEFARLRFALSHLDAEAADDSTRFLVQLTTFFGPHAHGVNW